MSRLDYSSPSLLDDPFYPRVKDFVIEATGLAYYADKDEDLAGRIGRRLSKLALRNCTSYLNILLDGRAGESELDALIEELTIGETYFFRHQEQFDILRDFVLPDLIERNQRTRRLRIWSAGCAIGAEPYSLAIMLKRELGDRIAGWGVTILGTDINREFLARAREGKFEEWALRGSPDWLKRACFAPSGKSWIIVPEYRECVSFQCHNLVRHPFPSLVHNLSAFDLILCRNVMIYFSPAIVRRLIAQFHQCLVEDGWLVVGHAEPNTELFRAFRTVNGHATTVYQRSREQKTEVDRFSPNTAFLSTKAERTQMPIVEIPVAWSPTPSIPEPEPFHAKHVKPFEPVHPALAELATVRLLADRGEWEEAAHCCEKVLAEDRLSPTAHFYHALVLEQMGLRAEAERSLRRAIYLDRTFVLAHYHLGLFLQKKGDARGAMRAFENVLKLLSRMEAGQTFPDGDGITVADLKELAEMHLEVLHRS